MYHAIFRVVGLLAGAGFAMAALAAELVVQLGSGEPQRYSTAQLLARPEVQSIQIANDVAYQGSTTYQALPMAALLAGVAPGQAVQVRATDGFVAELNSTPLLNTNPAAAQAWLAIEPPGEPWPALGPDRPSAGPFYVIWTNPQASRIGPEQWPYQTAEIRVTTSVAERFPATVPAASASAMVQQGWQVFQVNCLVCHTLNRQGDARKGPDLNVPYNPTEYWVGNFLRQYIRDPGSVRYWPQSTMPAFNTLTLPDPELDALLAYLQHMAAHKVAP